MTQEYCSPVIRGQISGLAELGLEPRSSVPLSHLSSIHPPTHSLISSLSVNGPLLGGSAPCEGTRSETNNHQQQLIFIFISSVLLSLVPLRTLVLCTLSKSLPHVSISTVGRGGLRLPTQSSAVSGAVIQSFAHHSVTSFPFLSAGWRQDCAGTLRGPTYLR